MLCLTVLILTISSQLSSNVCLLGRRLWPAKCETYIDIVNIIISIFLVAYFHDINEMMSYYWEDCGFCGVFIVWKMLDFWLNCTDDVVIFIWELLTENMSWYHVMGEWKRDQDRTLWYSTVIHYIILGKQVWTATFQ